MVVFLDLDEDVVPDDRFANASGLHAAGHHLAAAARLPYSKSAIDKNNNDKAGDNHVERLDPNLNSTTRALGCYPIIHQITHSIDLNTLHALSLTCRQIRSTLLQYRSSLINSTLHCTNETTTTSPTAPPSTRPTSSVPQWHFLGEGPRLVSGKVSVCARDLVAGCWRCHTVICRNCTIKSSQAPRLPSRHRRLCSTCAAAPLKFLIGPMAARKAAAACRNRDTPRNEVVKEEVEEEDKAGEEHCICAQREHLCAPCGTKLVNADTTYRRIWTWRTRYTTYLGGLGTGIGEGNEGVKCARGRECLEAKDVEVEFECPSSSGSDGSENGGGAGGGGVGNNLSDGGVVGIGGGGGVEPAGGGRVGAPGTPDLEDKAGYWRQEVEGLGGVVKKKFRKRERVGRTVREWEDEREGKGEILGREKSGECRSWCGWCGKLVREGDGDVAVGKDKWVGGNNLESRVVRIELRGVKGL